MPSLHVELEIEASRRKVWQALLRKDQWAYWNTFLYDCNPNQPFIPGQKVFLAMRRVPGEEETEFEPLVTLVQPGNCLQWVATIPGFASESMFELQDVGRDRTKYVHQARFSGMLTRMVLPFIRADEYQGIQRMAWELKRYVEGL
jgi:hypothetical protein